MSSDIVIIFDFDKTIIECDSDNWVVDELGATDLFNELRPTMPWNALMDRMMKEVYDQGKSIEDVKRVLERTPIHPRVVPAIKTAYELGCDLRIVSDANTFFIETILEHLSLKHCFTQIHTNPSFLDPQGRLRISSFRDFTKLSPSSCTALCPPNMCKTVAVQMIQADLAAEGKNRRIIYLGDGIGDYCPCLKLHEADFMMPRKDFPVWDLICKNRSLIKATVLEWSDGQELEKILLGIIENISIANQSSPEIIKTQELFFPSKVLSN